MKLARLLALGALSLGLSLAHGQGAERKVLRVSMREAETSFDPAKVDDLYSRTITGHIFESPYGYDPLAQPAKIRPLTAESMPEVSPDYRTWTVHIKPGIYFTDDPAFKGKRRELVAQDYVYAIERAVDPANKSPTVTYVLDNAIEGLKAVRDMALKTGKFDYDAPVAGLRALDRYTLQIHLTESRPRFVESMLAASDLFGAVAREVVEYYGADIDAHPVGTGPFRLKEWRRASLIVLERNPQFREMTYDAEPAADDAQGQAILARFKGRRLPMIDEVQVSIIHEDQPRWLTFLNGQTDMIGTIASPVPDNFVKLAVPGGKLAPNLAKQGVQAFRTLNADEAYVYFNMKDPIVGGYTPDKVALRRAISLGYDVNREIRLLRNGQAIPGQSPVVPHTSGYDPQFKSEMGDYDPARAKALLDLYGYVDRDGDGWRDLPDGAPLVLHMATEPDQTQRQYDAEWQRDMRALGLRILFEPAQWPENLKQAKAGKLMMWMLGESASEPDGQDLLGMFYGPRAAGENLCRFELPEYDAIFDKMSGIPDGPEREALYRQAKRLLVAYMPGKTLVHRVSTDLAHPWLIGFRRPIFWNDWWEYVDLDVGMRKRMLKH